MRSRGMFIALVGIACCSAAACDAVLGLGDIEVPGPGTAGAGGSAGAGGAAGKGGAAGQGGAGGATSACGDGDVDKPAEQCDDGDKIGGDGCTDCMIDVGWACVGSPSICMPTCGDGDQDLGEQCDDGGVMTGDGCNQGCQIEAGWECTTEPGMASVCSVSCGDQTIDQGEGCDIGAKNGDQASGCGQDCQPMPGWICAQPDGLSAPSVCALCGDGAVAAIEACDDGNMKDGDGCSAGCKLEGACGNGIVDPGEECDSKGVGCKVDCTLELASVCGQALLIQGGPVDMATGVRTSFFEGDSSATDLVPADVAAQPCDASINSPVLHAYTTGSRPSIVTVEALSTLADGSATFSSTVLWAYRDCPNKADLESCDDNGGNGGRSLLTTGYLPAGTTLFIALAGNGGAADKGLYRLKVTEQPVRLFYYQPFPDQVSPGVTDEIGDLAALDAGGTDQLTWRACMPGDGSCGAAMKSHSGGAYAFGEDGDNTQLTSAFLQSGVIPTPGVTTALRVQFDVRYLDTASANEFLKVESAAGSGVLTQVALYSGQSAEQRKVLSPPISDDIKFRFVFNDDSRDVSPPSIDDIYIYGY